MKNKRTRPDQSDDLPVEKKCKTEETSETQENNDGQLQDKVSLDETSPKSESKDEKETQKRKRVRMKTLRSDISKQLEFYFCDANLRKDRYMKELVAGGENGWVNVDEFLKFNKIKLLLEKKSIDPIEVAKAAKGSELVEVSSDMTKIRRNLEKFPIKEKNQDLVDDCTIYVQGLPPTASIDSIRSLFSDFGIIEYVSLPRKASGEHKGFAFVEFAEKDGAENSCKFHNLRTGGTGFNFATEDDRMNSSNRVEWTSMSSMQVISKREWLKYKQQYLKLRKEKAKMTKIFLSTFAPSSTVGLGRNHNQNNVPQNNEHNEEDEQNDCAIKEDKQNDCEIEEDPPRNDDAGELQDRLQYVPGCIVKFEASKPLPKAAKATLRDVANVLYVDMMENDPIAFLRFSSLEDSQNFLQNDIKFTDFDTKSKVILEGQEEQNYWERVESMRVRKRKRGREKQRGREKLQGRYEKHVAIQEKKVLNKKIVFDD